MRWLANERMEEELLSAEFEADDAFDIFDQPPVVEVDIHESDSEQSDECFVDVVMYKAIRRLCRACNSQIIKGAFMAWKAWEEEALVPRRRVSIRTDKFIMYEVRRHA